MKKLIFAILFSLSLGTHAGLISHTSISISSTGGVNNSGFANDGSIPAEFTNWQATTAWWRGTSQYLEFDLGALMYIDDMLISVDNNDDYAVGYFDINTSTWQNWFNVLSTEGNVTFGMDTMTSFSGADQVTSMSSAVTSPVTAQLFRIAAVSGDNSYSVGEVQFFSVQVADPVSEPFALGLLALGVFGIGIARKRATKK